MDSSSKKLRQMQNIVLNDTIVAITYSNQYFATACLDDSIHIWNNKFTPIPKQPIQTLTSSVTGILDIKLSNNSKYLATTSMDSIIKIHDLQTNQAVNIDVPVMSAWKCVFMDDKIITCGQLGHIQFYNSSTKQSVKKIDAGQIFLTSINISNDYGLLATGNNNGDLYIVNLDKKDRVVAFKPHSKLIRSLSFSEDGTKLVTGSDDTAVKIFDIVSQKVISTYDSHKEAVSCVRTHPTDNKIIYTCSFDKSIKIWDLRMKCCVDNFQSGSALWALQPIGKHLIAGGQNGALSIFSVE